jgi:hypothetical protein
MKTAKILLATIFWAVITRGACVGLQSAQAPSMNHQTVAGEGAKGNENTQAQTGKDEAVNSPDRSQTAPASPARTAAKGRTVVRPTKPAPSHPVSSAKKPANESLPAANTLADQPKSHPTGSSTSTGSPHKTVNPRSAPVPSYAESLNGQQFKNSRVPGSRMASAGGPANSTRGTAAINGSDMKRKF